jgi:hypothetical protein
MESSYSLNYIHTFFFFFFFFFFVVVVVVFLIFFFFYGPPACLVGWAPHHGSQAEEGDYITTQALVYCLG